MGTGAEITEVSRTGTFVVAMRLIKHSTAILAK
jgi:hypothetical protein